MHAAPHDEQMTVAQPGLRGGKKARTALEVSVSIRTILLVAGVVAVAWALTSIANVLLVIFVSVFSIAVLSPTRCPSTRARSQVGWPRCPAASPTSASRPSAR